MSNPEPSREERILNELQHLYSLKTGGGAAMVVLGGGVLLLAGVAFATVVWFVLWIAMGSSIIGWIGWFIVYAIVVGWITFRESKRAEKSFFADSVDPVLNDPSDPDARGEYLLSEADFGPPSAMDKLLWAPRTLLGGIATMRGQQPTRVKGLMLRGATIIDQLYASDDPIEVIKLAQSGGPPAEFREIMLWLDENDHIGLSSDNKRAWLSTRTRQHLSNTIGLNKPKD